MKQENATNTTMLVVLAFLLSMGRVTAQQERLNNREAIKSEKGISVKTHVVDRPFWKLHADDLNGDETAELIGCDVDDIVTVRNPGYLAPTGVQTVVKSVFSEISSATDMVTGETVAFSENTCPVQIERGTFRVIKVELK
jgi:hypothetical protein